MTGVEPSQGRGIVGAVAGGAKAVVSRWPWFSLVVLAPTLLTALYLYLFAADQYVSETKFMIRNAESRGAMSSVLGSALGAASLQPTAGETKGVQEYLISHDAVRGLEARLPLRTMFKRPLLDLLGRLNGDPSAEGLLKYYRRHVTVSGETESGLTTLQVRAFARADAQRIAGALLAQSEALVNQFNARAQADALSVAREEVARAETRVADINHQVADFRQRAGSLDPGRSSAMVTQVIGGMESELAKAKADLAVQSSFLKAGSPKLVALQSRVSSLERQVQAQNGRLAGGAASMAPAVSAYERLSLEREFADKEYTAAMASLEAARVDAQKKHLYLVRVVEPNLPETSLYPRRGFTVLTVFVSLLVAYGIGWLIVAGIREHAA